MIYHTRLILSFQILENFMKMRFENSNKMYYIYIEVHAFLMDIQDDQARMVKIEFSCGLFQGLMKRDEGEIQCTF